MRNVIVYHRGCPDGFGAAWWLRRHLLEHGDGVGDSVDVELVSANWGDRVDKGWADAHVWCVDFCFEAEDLRWLAANTRFLDVIDHHQTSLDYIRESGIQMFDIWQNYSEMGELGGLNSSVAVLDQRCSGVGLVARIVERWTGKAPPQWVWNLEDRDLWKFERPETKNVFAAVTARPYTIEAWDEMEKLSNVSLYEQGEAINLYRDQLIESVAASTFTLRLDVGVFALQVACATSPYFIGSDVAGLIAERSPHKVGAYAIIHADDVQIGLRSRNDGPDVAEWAEAYGGGGHRHASGLRMDHLDFMGAIVSGSVAGERHQA